VEGIKFMATQMRFIVSPVVIGSSKGIRQALEVCARAAGDNGPVLFQGELGTGKFLLATMLHWQSFGAGKPFLLVDCTEIDCLKAQFLSPGNATVEKVAAAGGSVYFHEVACLSVDDQARLHEFCSAVAAAGVKVMLGSSQNIHLLLYERAFDSDLYDFAASREIALPPLRQRAEDILQLAAYFIRNLNQRLRKSVQSLTPQVEKLFMTYRWPGNVAELQQVLTRAVILADEPYISRLHLTEYLGQIGDDGQTAPDIMPLEHMEEIMLRNALHRFGHSLEGKKKAARALNISLATLYNKIRRYNL